MKISHFLIKDNNNLDLARIILACLVIVGHSRGLNGEGNYWIDPISPFFSFTYAGAFAVKLFFFISGLVVTNSYLSKKNAIYFIVSRIFRIIPALLFVLIITVFVFGIILTKLDIYEYMSKLHSFAYIRHNLLFRTEFFLPGVFNENLYPNTVNGSLWSLRYEIGCYICLFFSFLLLGNRNKYYFIIPFFLILVDTLSLLPTRFIFRFLGDNSEVHLLPISFAYGVFFSVFSDKIKINIYSIIASIVLFILFKDTNYVEIVFILVSCNILVYLSSIKFVLKLKPKYDISYGIYLWGFLIQQTIFYYLGHIYIGFHCVLSIFLSVLFALITYVYIEKPFIKYGKIIIEYVNNFKTNSVFLK